MAKNARGAAFAKNITQTLMKTGTRKEERKKEMAKKRRRKKNENEGRRQKPEPREQGRNRGAGKGKEDLTEEELPENASSLTAGSLMDFCLRFPPFRLGSAYHRHPP